MGYDVSQQDVRHIVPCVWKRGFRGTEKHQHGVEKCQYAQSEHESEDGVQGHDIGQYLISRVVISLPEQH